MKHLYTLVYRYSVSLAESSGFSFLFDFRSWKFYEIIGGIKKNIGKRCSKHPVMLTAGQFASYLVLNNIIIKPLHTNFSIITTESILFTCKLKHTFGACLCMFDIHSFDSYTSYVRKRSVLFAVFLLCHRHQPLCSDFLCRYFDFK